MKSFLFVILILVFSLAPVVHPLAQTLVNETADSYTVLVPRGMGLGQVVRSVGKDPNWRVQYNGRVHVPNREN